MEYSISISDIESLFKQELQNASSSKKHFSIDEALQLVINFYTKYKIHGVDVATSDDDMLLFQYGIYDLHDGEEVHFTIDFTRQLRVDEDEEYFQLALTFFYEKQAFATVERDNTWSIDFESIEEWAASIQKTEGYRAACLQPYKFFKINLSQT